jgi:hypothetical protein
MALLRLPAIESLHKVLARFNEVDTCTSCGYPKWDHRSLHLLTKVATAILDRTGIGPTSTLEVTQTDGIFDFRFLKQSERTELLGLLARVRDIKALVRERMLQQPDVRLLPKDYQYEEKPPTIQ